jgi:hypothetical protein
MLIRPPNTTCIPLKSTTPSRIPSPPNFYLQDQSKSTWTALNLAFDFGNTSSKTMRQKMVEHVLYYAHIGLLHWDEGTRMQEIASGFLSFLNLCQILGFRSGAVVVFVLEGYGDGSLDECCSTFRECIVIPTSRAKCSVNIVRLNVKLLRSLETSGTNRSVNRRHIPRERRPP